MIADHGVNSCVNSICSLQRVRRLYSPVTGSFPTLTHWGRVTHICVGNLTTIGSDNGLSPDRRQTIIWTNDGILLIWPVGTNFNDILIKTSYIFFPKCIWKCRLQNGGHFISGLNVLTYLYVYDLKNVKCLVGTREEKLLGNETHK